MLRCAKSIPLLYRKEHPDIDRPLGADDFLPIFIYVVSQGDVEELVLIKELMCQLCDPDRRLSEAGYYVACFEAALEHIKGLEYT